MGRYPELEAQLKVDEQSGEPALDEVWIQSKRFPSYAVSSLGKVKSIANGQGRRSGVLACSMQNKSGYKRMRVTLREAGKTHYVFVHRLVLESFHGDAPHGCECCHKDGDATNNAVSNLYWGTRKQNQADSIRHGTKKNPPNFFGEKSSAAKLSDMQVSEIRANAHDGLSISAVSRHYGISRTHVRRILCGVSRRHDGE